jgi:hypothetical protein
MNSVASMTLQVKHLMRDFISHHFIIQTRVVFEERSKSRLSLFCKILGTSRFIRTNKVLFRCLVVIYILRTRSADLTVILNMPPPNWNCTLTPSSSTSMVALFTVTIIVAFRSAGRYTCPFVRSGVSRVTL